MFFFFLLMETISFLIKKKKMTEILDETSFYKKKKKKARKSFRITSESPFSTFHVRSVISDDEDKMVTTFLFHENTELDYVLKYLSALVNSIPDCYFYYLTIKKTR